MLLSVMVVALFQSTHPVGGGTVEQFKTDGTWLFQSTHPVGGGTAAAVRFLDLGPISIHPPRGGWDLRL